MSGALPIASLKLNLVHRRIRVVPALDLAGASFAGPGVDLVGDEIDEPLAFAEPVLAWIAAREHSRVRTMSVDVVRSRLLVTVEDKDRPRVLRIDRAIDAAAIREVLALMAPMLERLGELARRKLVERNRPRE